VAVRDIHASIDFVWAPFFANVSAFARDAGLLMDQRCYDTVVCAECILLYGSWSCIDDSDMYGA
jgi:hypothetical protein